MKKLIVFAVAVMISFGIAMNATAQEKVKTVNQKSTVTTVPKNDKVTATPATASPKDQKVEQPKDGNKEKGTGIKTSSGKEGKEKNSVQVKKDDKKKGNKDGKKEGKHKGKKNGKKGNKKGNKKGHKKDQKPQK